MENTGLIATPSQTTVGPAPHTGTYFDRPATRLDVGGGAKARIADWGPLSSPEREQEDEFEETIRLQKPTLAQSPPESGTDRDYASPSLAAATDSFSFSSPISSTGIYISVTTTEATTEVGAENTTMTTAPSPSLLSLLRGRGNAEEEGISTATTAVEEEEEDDGDDDDDNNIKDGDNNNNENDDEEEEGGEKEPHTVAAARAMITTGQGRSYKCAAALLLVVLYVGTFL
ncbi:hypothetical protein F4809DRAFT_331926 [Biscogniauxia mediterranea]|nr:hypothetical protein F4809DRAFT_331926 [Biscogniauxia mediterranea]